MNFDPMMNEKWYFDDTKGMEIFYDPQVVDEYDKRMNSLRDINAEEKDIREKLDIKPDNTILEIGTGTGEMACRISEHCCKVIAVDNSKSMLEIAQCKAGKRKRQNIDFCFGGFLSYQPQDILFDGIFSQLALHHLPDFWKYAAIQRIYNFLKPGGVFYLRDVIFSANVQDYGELFHNFANYFKTDSEISERVYGHIRDEFSTFDWVVEGFFRQAGFRIIDSNNTQGFMGVIVGQK